MLGSHTHSRALNICTRYPDYMVSFVGIGEPPVPDDQLTELGHCSQCAIFVRRDFWQRTMQTDIHVDETPIILPPLAQRNLDHEPTLDDGASAYKMIRSIVIPVHRDERTREQRIMYDCRQQINRLASHYTEEYYCHERSILAIPLQTAFDCLWRDRDFAVDKLRCIIKRRLARLNESNLNSMVFCIL